MAKLFFEHKFVGIIGPVWLEKELAQYGLGLFARFIGYSQVIIGFLLITLRYSTLGAVMSVPLIINILMVTISLEWQGTPYVLAVLLSMNLFVLWADRQILIPIVTNNSAQYSLRNHTLKGMLVWILSLVLIFMSIKTSYEVLSFAYVIVIAAFILAIISTRMDRKRG